MGDRGGRGDEFGRDSERRPGPGASRGGGGGGGQDEFGLNRRGMPKSLAGPAAEFMPPQILTAFRPRDPVPYLPLPSVAEAVRKPGRSRISGIAALVPQFETTPPPVVEHQETREQRRARTRERKAAAAAIALANATAMWNPRNDFGATRDAYKTLFVGRLAYETTDRKLERELGAFGAISSVRIVLDRKGNSRGYGFVEFASEEDMKRAFKRADGMRLDGRRIVVDVERGRTVRNWKPRRLGGGLGETRRAVISKKAKKQEGLVRPPIGSWSLLSSVKLKADALAANAAAAAAMAAEAAGEPRATSTSDGRPTSTSAGERGRDRSRSRSRERGGAVSGSGGPGRFF